MSPHDSKHCSRQRSQATKPRMAWNQAWNTVRVKRFHDTSEIMRQVLVLRQPALLRGTLVKIARTFLQTLSCDVWHAISARQNKTPVKFCVTGDLTETDELWHIRTRRLRNGLNPGIHKRGCSLKRNMGRNSLSFIFAWLPVPTARILNDAVRVTTVSSAQSWDILWLSGLREASTTRHADEGKWTSTRHVIYGKFPTTAEVNWGIWSLNDAIRLPFWNHGRTFWWF